jgi:hypothetical protein
MKFVNLYAAVKPTGGVANDEAPGAIFWVDLNSSSASGGGGGGGNGGGWSEPGKVSNADTHPGSALVAGGYAPAQQVAVQAAPDLSNWLKPGVMWDIPGVVAAHPGSTVTLTASNQLLNDIAQVSSTPLSQIQGKKYWPQVWCKQTAHFWFVF